VCVWCVFVYVVEGRGGDLDSTDIHMYIYVECMSIDI
jgi:hypothetical protein